MTEEATDAATVVRWWRRIGRRHRWGLFWHRTCGVAMCRGVTVEMDEPPAIPVGSVVEFWPGMTRVDGRDMSPEEAAELRRLLEQAAQDAKDALAGQSTLVVVTR